MKRYVSLFLCSLSLLSPELFAQSTTAGAYLNRGLQMFADKNFAGCIDQMSEAKRYGLADDELAEITPESIRLRKADLTRTRFN